MHNLAILAKFMRQLCAMHTRHASIRAGNGIKAYCIYRYIRWCNVVIPSRTLSEDMLGLGEGYHFQKNSPEKSCEFLRQKALRNKREKIEED